MAEQSEMRAQAEARFARMPESRAVLSPEERQANSHMMICVSRALTPSLTLDL